MYRLSEKNTSYVLLLFYGLLLFTPASSSSSAKTNIRLKKSIDLIAAFNLITDYRLPRETTPNSYNIEITPFLDKGFYSGRVRINITWQEPTDQITLHAGENLNISNILIRQIAPDDETNHKAKLSSTELPIILTSIVKIERLPQKPHLVLHLNRKANRGFQCELDIYFSGQLSNDTSEGLFRSSWIDPETKTIKWFMASHFRPNFARNAFPCYDEPAYKVPFTVSIARQTHMVALSNMPREKTEQMEEEKTFWVWDRFQTTPPMSTFTLGFLVADGFAFTSFNTTDEENNFNYEIRVWSRPDFLTPVALQNLTEKIHKSITILEEFWAFPYPLPKIDVLALPNYLANRPADNWGLLLFKESQLLQRRDSWHISQELAHQWLGALATPFWWSDAHINNALVRYVTAYTTLKMNENETFNNWPMTMLYSIYYEFSKRYPHGKNTAIKQDSTSAKTELIFRMLNYTLGERTFKHGLQRFMSDRQYKTFFGDDIWYTLTEQARFDGALEEDTITVTEIVASWITKDRLPVLNVTRDYDSNSAKITQRVYLRERPHDVPDQEKFVWWIPIVYVRQDKMNFTNSTPITWMKRQKEITLHYPIIPATSDNLFIIINPEEIGPFPVNYDTRNWNLLANYLCTENRTKIPVNTRAKLLHDAWNLAYAGDLSFATALNMTLFLKYERDYLAWDPVFTLIDHIGRHIDSSKVHKKFQTYVRLLLTPLYEELGNEPPQEVDAAVAVTAAAEPEGITHLRSSSKIFLCQAGYKPCIEEAQAAFKKWMEADNPDEGNPVSNQYICPVFKWGTIEEWQFGLERINKFPSNRKQNERTYLLKTLAGCPNDSDKIEKLLNITILEQNGNFTDNDVHLIFSMLTGSSNGYTTLFNFLKKNWDVIKQRFEGKLHLWNSLITSATSAFKTQEGLDMVSELYVQRQSEFGTADFVIEKALKNIKEETKWSNDNLPVIEKWLDGYLKENN